MELDGVEDQRKFLKSCVQLETWDLQIYLRGIQWINRRGLKTYKIQQFPEVTQGIYYTPKISAVSKQTSQRHF